MLIRVLIGLGIVLALAIAIVLVVSHWGAGPPETRAMAISLGDRTIMVAGYYKSVTQESRADGGIKVLVDGHEVTVAADQLTYDDTTRDLQPDKDVEIFVYKDGKVDVKAVDQETSGPEAPPQ